MAYLTRNDLLNVIEITRAILDSSQLNDLRCMTLDFIERSFDVEGCNFSLKVGFLSNSACSEVVSRGLQEEHLLQYREHYYKLNPINQYIGTSRSSVVTLDQITSAEELLQTEYYNEFLKPQSIRHQMTIRLKSAEVVLGGIHMFRPSTSCEFSESEIEKAELLAPYLASAVEKTILKQKINNYAGIINSVSMALPYEGIILLDQYLSPIFLNEGALTVIMRLSPCNNHNAPFSLCLPREIYLKAFEFKEYTMSDSCRHQNNPTQCFSIDGPEMQMLAQFHLIEDDSDHPVYLILLERHTQAIDLGKVLKGAGISQREAEIICCVRQGLKNSEIAEKLFISEYTVKNHLRSIYEKCGVKNRTSLAHMVLTH